MSTDRLRQFKSPLISATLTRPAMHYDTIIPSFQKELPPYVWYPRLFSAPEIADLIARGESHVLQYGTIGNGLDNVPVENLNYRCVKTCSLSIEEVPWAYERLADRVRLTNSEYFRFDIQGLYEQLIFLKYDYDPDHPGKYNWHQDVGGGMSSLRKISTVTQLSPPSNYDGCRLHLFTNADQEMTHLDPGDTILFPSYLPHCVTPIARGTRYSLVSWVSGQPFK